MLPRRRNSPGREAKTTSLAVIRQPAGPADRPTLADYVAAMELLACLVPPGAVQRLLENAEAAGVSIPDDLA
jgi:hypothetical protein